MKHGFVKVAAATPQIRVADPAFNAAAVCKRIDRAVADGAEILVLPELCLTGYTCGDLFNQPLLQAEAQAALIAVKAHTAGKNLLVFVGLPLAYNGKLYNAAAVLFDGRVLGAVPKLYLPTYDEFYEGRNFASGIGVNGSITIAGEECPFSANLLFDDGNGLVSAVEICEDLWAAVPPSSQAAQAGAVVIANLSASSETVGKADYRRSLVTGQSARLICGYIYADAGEGESTTDTVFSGHNLVAENGALLAESEPFGDGYALSEIDYGRMLFERGRRNTFFATAGYTRIPYAAKRDLPLSLTRPVAALPFVPQQASDCRIRAQNVLKMQSEGLRSRLHAIGCRSAVVGVSGGLDSALALLVTARAFDRLQLPRTGITAVTMPGFGTTDRTYQNALALTRCLGATVREIPIGEAVTAHLAAIDHPEDKRDVTYENAQARERTQILMDIANQTNGIVVGTGDLSELALGWATYNGDHMSMYGVNASVPKTLVKFLVRAEAERLGGEAGKILSDILDTEISPELLPPDESGKSAQKTEDLVGPYAVHDFILYWGIRWGCAPEKVLALAEHAFAGTYSRDRLLGWMRTFYTRFFAQQFKRSCSPDGVKVGSAALSPRGDWRMPSDAAATVWLRQIDALLSSEKKAAAKKK